MMNLSGGKAGVVVGKVERRLEEKRNDWRS
jgi:hypothetical protein